ncbi:MAG: hypothetical protein ACRERU_10150 [Methylococcales bacterium]
METRINTGVRFSVSEPEDFYFDNGEGPFDGVIVGYRSGVMFVKVRSKLQYHDKKLRYLAMVVRYEGESLSGLKADSHVVFNLVPLLVNDDVRDVLIEELVNLSKQFRGQHLIGEVWIAV